jgi:hypothetical protein
MRNMITHRNFGCTDNRETQSGKPRVAFASRACYFDTYNEASVATRSLMECLATWELPAMAMIGTVVGAGKELDPGNWLAEQGRTPQFFDGPADPASGIVPNVNASPCSRLTAGGVQVVLHRSPTTHPHVPEEPEIPGFSVYLKAFWMSFGPTCL